jgi:hypothetical protein
VHFVAGARELEGEQPPEQAGAGDGGLHRGRPEGGKAEGGGNMQLSLRRYEPVQVHGFGGSISATRHLPFAPRSERKV